MKTYKINEVLKLKKGTVSFYGVITEIDNPFNVMTAGGESSLRKCNVLDSTGFITLNSWRDHFAAEIGDTVLAKNVNISLYRGKTECSIGKSSTITVNVKDPHGRQLEQWYSTLENLPTFDQNKTDTVSIDIIDIKAHSNFTDKCITGVCIFVSDIVQFDKSRRTVVIKDRTASVDVVSWGNHFPIEEGDVIQIANFKINQFQGSISCNVDKYTVITKMENSESVELKEWVNNSDGNMDLSTYNSGISAENNAGKLKGNKRIVDEIEEELAELKKKKLKIDRKIERLETELHLHRA